MYGCHRLLARPATDTPGGNFDCLTDNVSNLLGPEIPGDLRCCPMLSSSEDWGAAVAIVVDRFTHGMEALLPQDEQSS